MWERSWLAVCSRLNVAWLDIAWLDIAWLDVAWLLVALRIAWLHARLHRSGVLGLLGSVHAWLCLHGLVGVLGVCLDDNGGVGLAMVMGNLMGGEVHTLFVVLLHHGVEVDSEESDDEHAEEGLPNRGAPRSVGVVAGVLARDLAELSLELITLRLGVHCSTEGSDEAEHDGKL